jgi:NDP-sugar pyrophosphorylase family protein
MGELTKATPKPMLRVLGKPLLEHQLGFLPKEIDEVVFIVGYLGNQIREYFGDEWGGRRIRYAVQEELNGTAGAVSLVKDMVGERFLVTMGDDLYHPDDLENLARHRLAILGYRVNDASRFGIMTTDDQGNLKDVVEQPHGFESGLVNTGAYVLSRDFFRQKLVPKKEFDKEFGLPQTLMSMKRDFPVKVETARAWQPVGRPEDLAAAESFLSELLPRV